MAISVTCKCGKTFTVAKDEWAGKRMSCPGCGETVWIPQPDPSTGRISPAVRVELEGASKSREEPTRVVLVGIQLSTSDLIPLLFQISLASVFVSIILTFVAGIAYFLIRSMAGF